MSGNGEQLVSFFLYSLFIYPVTNYIVSPQRKYPRWRGALYAILFLLSVSTLHMMYDNMEAGPNHYQLLKVTRDTPISAIKKAYRSLSLEFHPDKNKDPSAADMFTKIKHAFDIITDKDKRREYNRLGEHGVAVLAQAVVDYKYILIQMVVFYASSLVFAFLMTFSEPTNDAFEICIFGLLVMLLAEMLVVVQEVPLPSWFLPNVTPNDIVVVLHRLYPAFMNGCRCITGAFYVDRKAVRVAALEALAVGARDTTLRLSNIARSLLTRAEEQCEEGDVEEEEVEEVEGEHDEGVHEGVAIAGEGEGAEHSGEEPQSDAHGLPSSASSVPSTRKLSGKTRPESVGIMSKGLAEVRRRVENSTEGRSGAITAVVAAKVALIADPQRLRAQADAASSGWASPTLLLLRDVSLYLLARFLLVRSKTV